MFRTIMGNVRKIDGSAWATELSFRLFPGSFDLESQYPASIKKIVSGLDGSFSVSLWCNTEGLTISQYECLIGRDRFVFDLPPGTDPVNIGDLRALSMPISPPIETSLTPVERLLKQSDLTGDQVVIDFPKRASPVSVIISNNLDQEVQPTNVVFISDRAVRVSLQGYTPITGIWMIRVL